MLFSEVLIPEPVETDITCYFNNCNCAFITLPIPSRIVLSPFICHVEKEKVEFLCFNGKVEVITT